MTGPAGKDAGSEPGAAESDSDLIARLRRSGLPLGTQLNQISAGLAVSDPDYARAYDALVSRLITSQAGDRAPQQGDQMPDFLLPDTDGHLVSLHALCANGPVVIVFLRGHWCPYCRVTAAALAEVQDQIGPAQLVVVSAETGAYAKQLRDESGAHFAYLSDIGHGYALSLGLCYWIGDTLENLFAADACNIPAYQGGEGWLLPIPAVFVVNRDGQITARYVNPDFRQRMDMDALRAAALAASTADR
jgi:peroxiredoxin